MLGSWEFLYHVVFLPPHIRTKLLDSRFYGAASHRGEKGSFQRPAELLRTGLGGTFKDSDMKATIDS